jgi:hypothetical protein
MYKPQFTMMERADRMSLWVTMPDGNAWNIWDMDMGDVEVAESAIIYAFELGYHARGMVDTSIQMPCHAIFEGK